METSDIGKPFARSNGGNLLLSSSALSDAAGLLTVQL